MTTPHPAELTEAERVRLREDHGRRAGWEGRMCECGQRAPCATLRLLDALEAAERIAEAARKWGELNRAAAVEQSDRASEEAGKALDYLERLMAAERRVTAHMERAEKAEAAVGMVRGLIAAYGEAEGTPVDYEFLVSQISEAIR